MASSSKKKTTMAKMNREAAVRDRRLRKQAKKDARKLAALESHRSQLVSTMFVDASSPDHERQREAFRSRVHDDLAEQGALAGVPMGEAFKAITEL